MKEGLVNLVNKVDSSEIKNFIFRIISAILFIPFIILPIILKSYLLYLFYIFLLSLMTAELLNMAKIARKKIFLYIYLLVSIFTIFVFIIFIASTTDTNLKIIEIIVLIWIFDTFCYLGGKIMNGRKLMPKISKGKTFNGLYCGIFFTFLISYLYSLYIYGNFSLLLIITIPIIVLSFLGDLVVSLLKRSINIKDTGNIMPGHGGIIDRMDSFIFVFFVINIYLLIFI